MEILAPYSHAAVSLALYALIALLLAPLAGIARDRAGVTPGQRPPADYARKGYRISRAHANAAENAGIFAAVIAAAVLTGAAPFWVNLFASLAVLARVVMVWVHVQGIGSANMGPRSFAYVFGWLMMLLIAIMAVFAGFA
ncbi:MAPEG family protein [Sulfitobacter sp. D35]|uniref:MAPEG family protein n=1 Tax=Sulfitobacter sp. D35 TaxID=3083252 RepID=UPI00296E50AF|nr:MAPEG family protein [Sulfitobacter sp. D35]MDW4496893.1 MAPEG family protein [Sulfitobacter sp. D35]